MDPSRSKDVHVEVKFAIPLPAFNTGICPNLKRTVPRSETNKSKLYLQRSETNKSTIRSREFTARVGNGDGVLKSLTDQ